MLLLLDCCFDLNKSVVCVGKFCPTVSCIFLVRHEKKGRPYRDAPLVPRETKQAKCEPKS